jgi:hypothetical protein
MRYNLRYILGLQPTEETDSQRYGTSWHKIQQIVNLNPGDPCPDCNLEIDKENRKIPHCPICNEAGKVSNGGMDAVIRYLDETYAVCPMGKTLEEWETERIILLYSLIGYNWYYKDKQTEEKIIAQEISFRLPLTSPISKRKLPNVFVDGRIDKIIQTETGKTFIKELKSTGDSVALDSDFWKHLTLDTQTLLYIWAARQLGYSNGQLLYDVWHKPQIRPKMLTQAESKIFMETGDYCNQKFEIGKQVPDEVGDRCIPIGDKLVTMEIGKKEGTFAIRETPEMFGARLLDDITQRPEFYFCTKEIARTDADIEQFEKELFNMHQTIRTMKKINAWWCNEHACEATFKCPFLNICYNHITVDLENLPQGFECRFKKEGA